MDIIPPIMPFYGPRRFSPCCSTGKASEKQFSSLRKDDNVDANLLYALKLSSNLLVLVLVGWNVPYCFSVHRKPLCVAQSQSDTEQKQVPLLWVFVCAVFVPRWECKTIKRGTNFSGGLALFYDWFIIFDSKGDDLRCWKSFRCWRMLSWQRQPCKRWNVFGKSLRK